GTPQLQPPRPQRRDVLRLLPVRRHHGGRGERPGRARATPPHDLGLMRARPRPRPGRRPAEHPRRRHRPPRRNRRLRLPPPRRRRPVDLGSRPALGDRATPRASTAGVPRRPLTSLAPPRKDPAARPAGSRGAQQAQTTPASAPGPRSRPATNSAGTPATTPTA